MVEKIDAEKAKQGRSGRRVLAILIAALVLAFIAWGIADLYFFRIAPDDRQYPAEQEQSDRPTTPEQHLDNPSKAVPQQTKPLPKDLGEKPPGTTAR